MKKISRKSNGFGSLLIIVIIAIIALLLTAGPCINKYRKAINVPIEEYEKMRTLYNKKCQDYNILEAKYNATRETLLRLTNGTSEYYYNFIDMFGD